MLLVPENRKSVDAVPISTLNKVALFVLQLTVSMYQYVSSLISLPFIQLWLEKIFEKRN